MRHSETTETGTEPSTSETDGTEYSLSKAKIILSKTSYTYNKKQKQPSVKVTIGEKRLTKNKDYKAAYQNNVEVGTASVIVTGTGAYKGTVKKAFRILPKGTVLSGKIRSNPKGFTVKWKKLNNITGYQIQYSTSGKFTKKATFTKIVKKAKMKELTVKKLKANKKYYFRIRTYQIVKGKKYFSEWSKAKTVKTGKGK